MAKNGSKLKHQKIKINATTASRFQTNNPVTCCVLYIYNTVSAENIFLVVALFAWSQSQQTCGNSLRCSPARWLV